MSPVALMLLLTLGQDPEAKARECQSRAPGLHCYESTRTASGTSCSAICAYGTRSDGGTYRKNVHSDGPKADDAACKANLKAQCG